MKSTIVASESRDDAMNDDDGQQAAARPAGTVLDLRFGGVLPAK